MIVLRESFETAAENMAFDQALLEQSQPVLRVYQWQHPGVTYAYRQTLPEGVYTGDSARRPTGGGIVFHGPNDVVFSLVLPITTRQKGVLKQVLTKIQQSAKQAFQACGVSVEPLNEQPFNAEFCSSYHSPYEWQVNGQKVLGLAVRRFRYKMMVQGILHGTSGNEPLKLSEKFIGSVQDQFCLY